MSDNKGIIFVVDDTEENLNIIATILENEVSRVFLFPSGAEVIAATKKIIPDLILLDIVMPEMDGYETCTRIKNDSKTKDIPIIFLTAKSETDDIVKGFKLGSIDYIIKPFKKDELLARVRTQIRLSLSEKALKESLLEKEKLLDETLKGSIKVLIEILAVVSPEVFAQTVRLRALAKKIIERLNIKNAWEIEIGVLLSQIGCASIPEEILKKRFLGYTLTPEETIMFYAHPIAGAKFISNIPRLEKIAQSIRVQFSDHKTDENENDLIKDFIQVLFDYDISVQTGKSSEETLEKMNKKSEKYNPLLLKALEAEAKNLMKGFFVKSISLEDLKIGMVLADDIRSERNMVLVEKNSEISEIMLEKISNYKKFEQINEPIKIMEASI